MTDPTKQADAGPSGLELWQAYCDKKMELEDVQEDVDRLRKVITNVCEGWTLPDGVRKILETAMWGPRDDE